jgi:hypothetical protein
MEPSATELDTFKVISNADTVDWSRTVRVPKPAEDDDWGGVLSEDAEYQRIIPPFEENSKPMLSPRHSPPRDDAVFRRSMTPLPKSPKPEPEEEKRDDAEKNIHYEEDKPRETYEPRETRESDDKSDKRETSEPRPPRRFVRAPVKYSAAEENEDYEIRHEKEAILNEILGFTRPPHNFKLTREWNVATHTLDELQFELDRINSETNANSVVDMAKSGIKFGVSGIEMFLKQQGFDAADGWYTNSCKDMSKFNRPLTRLYKKYWRNTQLSPLTEMAYLLGGSLAWTIAENKMGMRKSSAPVASAPRASAFEPDSQPSSGPGRMRPPSNSFAPSKWSAASETQASASQAAPQAATVPQTAVTQTAQATQNAQAFPAVPQAAPANAPANTPANAPANDLVMQKLSEQNALMIQLLQGMQNPHPPQLPTTHVSPPSPRSKSASPNIRIRSIGGRKSSRTPHIVKKLNRDEDSMAL